MSHSQTKPAPAPTGLSAEELEATIVDLAKRHRVSQAIVREIARNLPAPERSAIERQITRGKSRR